MKVGQKFTTRPREGVGGAWSVSIHLKGRAVQERHLIAPATMNFFYFFLFLFIEVKLTVQ